MKTLTKKNQAYSFETTVERVYVAFTNNELVDRYYEIKEEISTSRVELLKDKLRVCLKMIKRELIKRNLEVV